MRVRRQTARGREVINYNGSLLRQGGGLNKFVSLNDPTDGQSVPHKAPIPKAVTSNRFPVIYTAAATISQLTDPVVENP